jgi:hypothetical protein
MAFQCCHASQIFQSTLSMLSCCVCLKGGLFSLDRMHGFEQQVDFLFWNLVEKLTRRKIFFKKRLEEKENKYFVAFSFYPG